MISPQSRSLSHAATIALLAFSVGIVALYLLRPIADPDFFWHLKTGQWILQHQSLPDVDPFSLVPPAADDLRSSFILTSYWLAQTLYAALYSFLGWWGIALLRGVLVAIMAALFAWRCDLRQPVKISLLLLVAVQILEVFPLERPQVFSFVFFAALLVVLDRYREQDENTARDGLLALLTAMLMLLWANMHGGFFVGQVTLLLFVVMEGVKFLHPALTPLSKRRYSRLCMIACGGVIASYINPNPLNSLKLLFNITKTDTFLFATNAEFYSLLQIFREYNDFTVLLNWLTMAIVLCCVLTSLKRKRLDITWFVLLAGTAFMGNQNARYTPFFLIATLFYLGSSQYEWGRGNVVKTVLIVTAFSAAIFFSRDEVRNIAPFIRGQWGVDQSFPVSAADFTLQNNLPGPIFNTYLWGGYLIWRLGPERKIFCDGRALDPDIYWEYLRGTMGTRQAAPYWKKLFRTYNIQTVIVQKTDETGRINSLTAALHRDSHWSLVFAQDNATIFIRAQGDNK